MLILIGVGEFGMSQDVGEDTFDQFNLDRRGRLRGVQGRYIVKGRQRGLRLIGAPVFRVYHGWYGDISFGDISFRSNGHRRWRPSLERSGETEIVTAAEPFKELLSLVEFVGPSRIVFRQELSDLTMG
jgi:hypothetical protein